MKITILFAISILFFAQSFAASLVKADHKITVIKQWHPSPGVNTEDIEASKKMPQYKNQIEIYKSLQKKFADKKLKMIIAEGCEGVIDDKFSAQFYGWSYSRLKENMHFKKIDEILAFIPLKIEVLHPEIETVCGDNEKLIKDSQLNFSDLRAYAGLYGRLVEFKGKSEDKFKTYAQTLFEVTKTPKEQQEKIDPIQLAKEKALESLKKFKSLISDRNKSFIEIAKANYEKDPIIIIGGLHANEIEEKLKAMSLAVEVVEPQGYQSNDEKLVDQLELILRN